MALTDKLTAIGNAIRAKTGGSALIPLADMPTAIAAISGKESLTWHQCPEAVRNYLSASKPIYESDTSYQTSVIWDYAPSTPSVSNTKPVGKTVDSITYYDNVPGVAEPFSTASKAGTLTALDQLRWINTTAQSSAAAGANYPRGVNTRDIGGWSCGTGSDSQPCTVRYGMIYRGSEPNVADRELMVEKLGIKSELQLLPTNEQWSDRNMKSVWGIDWYGNDTESSSVYGIDSTAANKYLWKKFLGAVFDSTAKGKPIYIHCGIGADRTGAVMMMVEALLGVSEVEICQDYELTNFAFNNEPSTKRRRDVGYFEQYMTAIKSVSLITGLSDTLEGHAISFALSLGFTAAQINAFRNACIDGSPVQIAPTMASYTVTKDGTQIATVDQFQGYELAITPASGYVISSVSVTMGGESLNAFEGTAVNLYKSITNTLSHCTTDSNRISVINGQCYCAGITADSGYTLAGATVSITMGGVEVAQQYYSDGKISIPNVTGNVVITVSAVAQGPSYTNLADKTGGDWKAQTRIQSSTGGLSTQSVSNTDVTNGIPVTIGDVVRLKGFCGSAGDATGFNGCYAAVFASLSDTTSILGKQMKRNNNYSYDSTNDIITLTVPGTEDGGTNGYARFMLNTDYASNDIIITVNEPIV